MITGKCKGGLTSTLHQVKRSAKKISFYQSLSVFCQNCI